MRRAQLELRQREVAEKLRLVDERRIERELLAVLSRLHQSVEKEAVRREREAAKLALKAERYRVLHGQKQRALFEKEAIQQRRALEQQQLLRQAAERQWQVAEQQTQKQRQQQQQPQQQWMPANVPRQLYHVDVLAGSHPHPHPHPHPPPHPPHPHPHPPPPLHPPHPPHPHPQQPAPTRPPPPRGVAVASGGRLDPSGGGHKEGESSDVGRGPGGRDTRRWHVPGTDRTPRWHRRVA